jgi:hypothetical protein
MHDIFLNITIYAWFIALLRPFQAQIAKKPAWLCPYDRNYDARQGMEPQ